VGSSSLGPHQGDAGGMLQLELETSDDLRKLQEIQEEMQHMLNGKDESIGIVEVDEHGKVTPLRKQPGLAALASHSMTDVGAGNVMQRKAPKAGQKERTPPDTLSDDQTRSSTADSAVEGLQEVVSIGPKVSSADTAEHENGETSGNLILHGDKRS